MKKTNFITILMAIIAISFSAFLCFECVSFVVKDVNEKPYQSQIDYNHYTRISEETTEEKKEESTPEVTYSVSVSITKGSYTIDKTSIKNDESATIVVTANEDYVLPESIIVSSASYTYNSSTGQIAIHSPTGNVRIQIYCNRIQEVYTVKTANKPTEEELKTLDYSKGNYVLACDYYGDQTVVMYDLDYYQNNLEECEIWTLKPTLIDPVSKKQVAPSSCICAKLRYTTQYGLVCLVGNTYGYICLYSFPSGELLKYYKVSQPNLHSCEILPNGTVVSMGINDNYIRLHNPGASSYVKYEHGELGHSIIYDSKEEKLYTAGGNHIKRWNISYSKDNSASLVFEKTYDFGYPSDPHDITFDPFDDNVIYVSDNSAQYKFYKDTFTVEIVGYIYQCKAYGYNKLGTLIYNYSTFSYLTHSITAQYKEYRFPRELTSSYREFYKTSPVNIDYMY